jgi:hypothetical protein
MFAALENVDLTCTERPSSLIARLMAGLETPGDLNEEELMHHQADMLQFLEDERRKVLAVEAVQAASQYTKLRLAEGSAREAMKRALKAFVEWHVDEVTDEDEAQDYAVRLVERLWERGVALSLDGVTMMPEMSRSAYTALLHYQELHDRLSEIIEDGRLTSLEAEDYQWIVEKLAAMPQVQIDMKELRPQGDRILKPSFVLGQEAFVITLIRKKGDTPKLEKCLDERFFWTKGEAEARWLKLQTTEMASWEIRPVVVHFVAPSHLDEIADEGARLDALPEEDGWEKDD